MENAASHKDEQCYHCGADCGPAPILEEEKAFCCNGCVQVYHILADNGLENYYKLNTAPGVKAGSGGKEKYAFLDHPEVLTKLHDFNDGKTGTITFRLPSIHCTSCIWLLEKLPEFFEGIIRAEVNFPRKELWVSYNLEKTTLRKVVEYIANLGYEPDLSLDKLEGGGRRRFNARPYVKLGIAGFCAGNIMMFSFPEYFNLEDVGFSRFFSMLNVLLSIPVVFYAAADYFRSAYKGLKHKSINMDVPIAIGIAVLFLRSVVDIGFELGPGYLDSLAGLVFFLLLGKLYQEKTYESLAFDRDYKSYFPIAVTRMRKGIEEQIPVTDLKAGDRIYVRNGELIPADAVLMNGTARIDYSFVTGESDPVEQESGAMLYAGGRQQGGALELSIVNEVSQSYLTKLWGNKVFQKPADLQLSKLADKVSKYFTLIVLGIAAVSAVAWFFIEPSRVFVIVTAVLIVACPCALALSFPFTLGNAMRILGKRKFFLKTKQVIEKMESIDTIVLDKTGTLTSFGKSEVEWIGETLSGKERSMLVSIFRQSTHPLSRSVAESFGHEIRYYAIDSFEEIPGEGVCGIHDGIEIKAGSRKFIGTQTTEVTESGTKVYVSVDGVFRGCFIIRHAFRKGIEEVLQQLAGSHKLYLLTGDNDRDRKRLDKVLPADTSVHFSQSPEDKLSFVESLKDSGHKVMMVGDGLNDAGALKAADVGVSVTESIHAFTPASDVILEGGEFEKIPGFFRFAKGAMRVIRASFALSLLYNTVGLIFAVTGHLSPLVAAILMPASSLSVVIFTTLGSRLVGWKTRS